jgi:hypothetical protein
MTTTPTRFQANCFYCTDPLDTRDEGVSQWVEGWVEHRNQGGGHAIRMPVRHNRWACKFCVDKGARRGAVLQTQLFD